MAIEFANVVDAKPVTKAPPNAPLSDTRNVPVPAR